MSHSSADGPTGVMGAAGAAAVLADAASVSIWAKVGVATMVTSGAVGIFGTNWGLNGDGNRKQAKDE